LTIIPTANLTLARWTSLNWPVVINRVSCCVASRTRKIKYKASSKETAEAAVLSELLLRRMLLEAAFAGDGNVVNDTSVVAAVTADRIVDQDCRRDSNSSSGGGGSLVLVTAGPFLASAIGSMVVEKERTVFTVGIVNAVAKGPDDEDDATAKIKMPMARPTELDAKNRGTVIESLKWDFRLKVLVLVCVAPQGSDLCESIESSRERGTVLLEMRWTIYERLSFSF
jgi:hypothetical protein